jgi:type VI secretion system protein VasD
MGGGGVAVSPFWVAASVVEEGGDAGSAVDELEDGADADAALVDGLLAQPCSSSVEHAAATRPRRAAEMRSVWKPSVVVMAPPCCKQARRYGRTPRAAIDLGQCIGLSSRGLYYLSHEAITQSLGILIAALEGDTMSFRPAAPAQFEARHDAGCDYPLRRQALVVLAVQAAATAAGLTGCASGPKPPKPTIVSATVQTAAGANPDMRKRPSPLVIRVYELKSAAAFEASDFLSLYDRDQATLAAEMSGREEFILRPGESKPWEKTVAPDTKFIGIIAAYRDIERAHWKDIVALKPNVKNVIAIKAEELSIGGRLVSP